METVSNDRKRWPATLFFLVAFLAGITLIWQILDKSVAPRYQRLIAGEKGMRQYMESGSFVWDDVLYLARDVPLACRDIRVVYRGRRDGSLLLDLFLLDLDPEYSYPYMVKEASDSEELRLGKGVYVVRKVRPERIRLQVVYHPDITITP